jgi:hypothetical protein
MGCLGVKKFLCKYELETGGIVLGNLALYGYGFGCLAVLVEFLVPVLVSYFQNVDYGEWEDTN